ncbi:MAG: MFS transporter [Rhodospirillales bacterium]
MRAALFAVWPMLLAAASHAVGYNGFSTYSIIAVTESGYPNILIGFISTAYYVGLMLGGFLAFRLIGQVGHIRVFSASAGLMIGCVLVVPFVTLAGALNMEPVVWALVRFTVGIASSALVICLESWLNERSTNEIRGQVIALYQVVFYGFASAGNLLIGISDDGGKTLMIILAAAYAVALLPVTLSRVESPTIPEPGKLSLVRLYRVSPLGFVGIFMSGVTLGMLFGAGPLFASLNGLNVDQTSYFMSAAIAGALLLIWPAGKISDMVSRRVVLVAVCLIGGAAGGGVLLIPTSSWGAYLAAACVLGGCLTAVYPLALSHINDWMDAADLSAAASGIMVIFGLGAIFGPLLAAVSMDMLGAAGYVWSILLTLGLLAGFASWRTTQREALEPEDTGEFQSLPTSSAVAFDLVEQDEAELEQTWIEAIAVNQEQARAETPAEDEWSAAGAGDGNRTHV